jgi:hypothetical protein
MVVFMPALGQRAENATCTVSNLFLKEDQDLANRTEEVHVSKFSELLHQRRATHIGFQEYVLKVPHHEDR